MAMQTTRTVALSALTLFVALQSASAATFSGNAQVTIYHSLSINVGAGGSALKFGNIFRPSTGSGTVTVNADGTESTGGGLTVTGTHSAAEFSVSGEGSASVMISVPAFTLSGPSSASLAVTPVCLVTNNASTDPHCTSTQTFSGGGGALTTSPIDVKVGGTITVPSSQLTGVYTGSFNVNAAYQ